MDACTLGRLQSYSDQLATAVNGLAAARHAAEAGSNSSPEAKATILASVEGIRALLDEPDAFLQRLTTQVEILACLQWLAEFQILECIPQEVSLSIADLADLTGAPESQLRRVVRLTASAGFLQETTPNCISHTPMSAQFLASQALCDAAAFIAASVTPAALRMADATRLTTTMTTTTTTTDSSDRLTTTAYELALNPPRPFRAACQERPRLSRQWKSYLTHAARLHSEDEMVDTFSRLNWSNLGNACTIVEVGAQSTSMARSLARTFPNLHLLVQINNTDALTLIQDGDSSNNNLNNSSSSSNNNNNNNNVINNNNNNNNHPYSHHQQPLGSGGADFEFPANASSSSSSGSVSPRGDRITVTFRETGMPQPVAGAAVYILHPPAAAELARTELLRHLAPLRASGGIVLVLTTRLLPEPGSLPDRRVEAVARARDLSMLQVANEGEMEMTELLQVVGSVSDEVGKLVVANELRSHTGQMLALALKHLHHGS